MEEKTYPFNIKSIEVRYEFESINDVKIIRKTVAFTQTKQGDIYNLALLDIFNNNNES